ncbi:hypothetical protein HKD37_10G027615 [Glycine soja]
MESKGQKGTVNSSTMLASLLSRRAKLHEELHNIEKHVYFSALAFGFPSKGAETFSHCVCTVTMSLRLNWACSDELLDLGQCGNALKGFEAFLSSSKNMHYMDFFSLAFFLYFI